MAKTRVLFVFGKIPPGVRWQKPFSGGYAGDRYEAFSAGLGPGPMNPLTTMVMEEKGISMRGSLF